MAPSKKKKRAADQSRRKSSSEKSTVNPFEVKVNRKKHDVLGQRRKSDSGRPGSPDPEPSRRWRKKTLLVEYQKKSKANKLVDRRFGESEENLSVEEKMMRRFVLERKRRHERSSLFNLNEEEEELTHYGRSLGEIDRFDDPILTDDEGAMDEEDIGETHFGGFLKKKRPLQEEEEEEEAAPPKTRKQILDEIVSKSKALKYERQSERMEVENLMEKVDSDWKAVHSLLPKALQEEGGGGGRGSGTVEDYDRAMRELQFERRGQAVDRLKSEEEQAVEETRRLEALEAARIRRMELPLEKEDVSKGVSDTRFMVSYQDGKLVLPDGEELDMEGESDGDSEDEELMKEKSKKEQESLGIMLDHCMKLAEHPTHHNMAALDGLASPLFKLCQVDAHHAASIFNKVLAEQYKEWSQKKKHHLPFRTLVTLQLAGLVFSASDYDHPVTTPAFHFMAQSLVQSQVKSELGMLHGLIQCGVMMQYIRDSKRFAPELVNFLTGAMGCFSKSKKCILLPPFKAKCRVRQMLSMQENLETVNSANPTVLEMLGMCTDSSSAPVSKCDLLTAVVEMNSRVVQLYRDLPSFPELFAPLSTNLSKVASAEWPVALQESMQALQEKYSDLAARPRDTPQLLKQKPKSIKFYEPKFDTVYEVNKRRRGTKGTKETQKLKYKLKRETKGAVRELKKDAAFLAKVKLKETLLLDAERHKKTRQLMHELQTQQHEAKVERLRTKKR